MKLQPVMLIFSVLLAACGSSSSSDPSSPSVTQPVTAGNWYQPALNSSWQIQLDGTVNTGYDVDLYDIDLFDTSAQTIADIQAAGHHVICYFSGGSYESWRTDEKQFDSSDLGNNLDGWPGERWLDVRSNNVRNIMLQRLELAVSKGCDGVDVDNMDGYTNSSGFALTASDQLDFNRYIANAAHDRELAVALKNDLDQISDLVDYFDFAVNEECFDYSECSLLDDFVQQNKPVLQIEYKNQYVNDASARSNLCTQSLNLHFSTLIMPMNLDDSFRYSCL
jgi:hypothetical protein